VEKFFTLQEISDSMQIPVPTLRKYIKSGSLKSFRVGKHLRVSESQFQEFLKSKLEGCGEVKYFIDVMIEQQKVWYKLTTSVQSNLYPHEILSDSTSYQYFKLEKNAIEAREKFISGSCEKYTHVANVKAVELSKNTPLTYAFSTDGQRIDHCKTAEEQKVAWALENVSHFEHN
jgi:excisionase family DNA binding protein